MNDAKRLLSPRQAECLRRVRALQSTDEIARDLQISTGTVNGYIRDAISALGARDRRHAALIFEGLAEGRTDTAQDAGEVPPGPVDEDPHFHAEADLPPPIVRDAAADRFLEVNEVHLRRVFREILDGSRPEGWSMMTRSFLILAAVVVIGMSMLFMSASLGIAYSLAAGIRSARG